MSRNHEQHSQQPAEPDIPEATHRNVNTIKTERSGPVFVVTIDRPRVRNAVDGPTADALLQAFRAFDADAALSVAILTGAGNTFCSGFDLTAMQDQSRGLRVAEEGDGPLGVTRMLLSKPVIAAVEGYAVAGGLELALWCDLRVAAENAVFGVYNRRWGVPLVDEGTIRLPRLIGHSHALDLILTGRGISGQEARLRLQMTLRVSRNYACAQTASLLTNSGRSRRKKRGATRPGEGLM
jgi:enoyl-CoA hydratase